MLVLYKTSYMKLTPAILPKNLKILKDLGEHIQLARLRRKLSAEQIAERTRQPHRGHWKLSAGTFCIRIRKRFNLDCRC